MRKGHGEIGEECHAIDAEVGRQVFDVDDGARTDIDEGATLEVTVLQVDIELCLAAHDDTEAVVVDGEGGLLLFQHTEQLAVGTYYSQFTIEKDILA